MGSSSSCGVESVWFNLFTLPWNSRESDVVWYKQSALRKSEIGIFFTPAAGSQGRVTKHSVVRISALYAYLMLKFQECLWRILVVTSTKRSRFLQRRLIWTTTVNVPGDQQLEQNSGFPRIQKRQLFQTRKSQMLILLHSIPLGSGFFAGLNTDSVNNCTFNIHLTSR